MYQEEGYSQTALSIQALVCFIGNFETPHTSSPNFLITSVPLYTAGSVSGHSLEWHSFVGLPTMRSVVI